MARGVPGLPDGFETGSMFSRATTNGTSPIPGTWLRVSRCTIRMRPPMGAELCALDCVGKLDDLLAG